jgi:hypothetical protein
LTRLISDAFRVVVFKEMMAQSTLQVAASQVFFASKM